MYAGQNLKCHNVKRTHTNAKRNNIIYFRQTQFDCKYFFSGKGEDLVPSFLGGSTLFHFACSAHCVDSHIQHYM